MTAAGPARLTLEVDPGAEPIGGQLVGATGQRYAFAGWMELIAQIEVALAQLREEASGERR